jgi:hypothetical protein
LGDSASSVKLQQALDLLWLKPCADEVTVDAAATGSSGLAKVLRMKLQAVVDHVLHVLRNHHHRAVALAAIDALGFCGFGA